MRCVVTGGAGFIGSNLVDALVERGDEVTVIDSLVNGKRANLEDALARGATLSVTDVRDADGDSVSVRTSAAGGRLSPRRPGRRARLGRRSARRRDVNVLGTITVLEAARAAGATRVINSSTGGGLYGDAEVIPTPEDPRAASGRWPRTARASSLPRATASCSRGSTASRRSRCATATSTDLGRTSTARPASSRSSAGASSRAGTPVVFGDGRQTRDWVEVGDVVRANLLAADAASLTGPVNIGHGQETSVRELIDALRDVGSSSGVGSGLPEASFVPARAGEVQRSCIDVRRAREQLGWEASVSLRDGLRRILSTL